MSLAEWSAGRVRSIVAILLIQPLVRPVVDESNTTATFMLRWTKGATVPVTVSPGEQCATRNCWSVLGLSSSARTVTRPPS